MNILFYYVRPLKRNDGGIASITLSLSRFFSQRGDSVYVLSRNGILDNNCSKGQYVLPSPVITSNDNVVFVKELLNDKKIDVVINQIPIDDESEKLWIVVRRECGIKIISCFHNPITLSAKNIAYRKYYLFKKHRVTFLYYLLRARVCNSLVLHYYIKKNRKRYLTIVQNSDLALVLCEGMKKELEEMLGGDSKEYLHKIRIIPNFIDSKEENFTSKEKLIVWCGHIDFDVKRIDAVLDFWKLFSMDYPDWNLAILGDGPCLEEAKSLCNQMQLQGVSFEGRVSPDSYYQRACFTIVTSAYESFSLVTLESMSHGSVPVVFNTFPAASYIINGEEMGLLVKPYDYKEALRMMNPLISNDTLHEKFRVNAIKRSKFFNMKEIGKLWDSALYSI